MTALGELLPDASLAVLSCGTLAALLLRPAALWALPASLALFVLNLFVSTPSEQASTAELHLHPFPVTLLLLMLTFAGMSVSALIGYLARTIYRLARCPVLGTGDFGPHRKGWS